MLCLLLLYLIVLSIANYSVKLVSWPSFAEPELILHPEILLVLIFSPGALSRSHGLLDC